MEKINIYGSGNQTRTYCYITDAMEGFLRVLYFGKPGEAYNIGNNIPEVSVKKIYYIFQKINDEKLKQILLNIQNHIQMMSLKEDVRFKKAKQHLSYYPKVKLENGLKKFLDWAKVNYKKY